MMSNFAVHGVRSIKHEIKRFADFSIHVFEALDEAGVTHQASFFVAAPLVIDEPQEVLTDDYHRAAAASAKSMMPDDETEF